jgi:hypothetical protein
VVKGMRRIIGVICGLVTGGMLVAALWPFEVAPKNEVGWLTDRNGLQFGDEGTILSSGSFDVAKANEASFCSLEIALQPARGDVDPSETILAFYVPDNPLQFRLTHWMRWWSGENIEISETGRRPRSSRSNTHSARMSLLFLRSRQVRKALRGTGTEGLRRARDISA